MNKRILIVFHMNFLLRDRGCSVCVYEIAKKLKELGHSLDFFTTDVIDNRYDSFNKVNDDVLIDNLYYFTQNTLAEKYQTKFTEKKIQLFGRNLCKKVTTDNDVSYFFCGKKIYAKKNSSDINFFKNTWVNKLVLKVFQEIINQNAYDYIFVHYIQWADLIRYTKFLDKTKTVYYMQDTNFQHAYYAKGIELLGKNFAEELQAIQCFDAINCISFDELLFWSRFISGKKFYFLPHMISRQNVSKKNTNIDILFIGANNPYNIFGLKWFLDFVYPLLSTAYSITICGEVLQGIGKEHIEKIAVYKIDTINFAEDLSSLYARTKIAISPMFKGAGMKIKTIEAMSYSIPVVSTLLGVDGFPDKFESGCLVSDEPDIFAANINKLLTDSAFYLQTVKKINNYFDSYLSADVNIIVLKKIFK